jgi:hydroxymethylglutaryl-CoA reductase (NADPH)
MSMPCIEVATIGGGTHLKAQAAALKILEAPHHGSGMTATRLASIILAAVMASELSLCSALAAGHLMNAHLRLNRKES